MPRNSKGHVMTVLAQCRGCLDIFDVEALVIGRRIVTVFPHKRIQDIVKYRQHHYTHVCDGHQGQLSFFL